MPRLHKQTPEEKERYRTGQRNAKGQLICGAKKRNGQLCTSVILFDNGRCKMHGGPSPKGPASPNFVTGRMSRYLPKGLRERYEAFIADPDIVALTSEIALTDARLSQLVQMVDVGESGARWASLKAAYAELQAARSVKDDVLRAQRLADSVNRIGALIEQGAKEVEVWSEIGATIEQRRKLAESEQRRLVAMQQTLTAEQALMFMTAVLDVIRMNVSDRDVLQRISVELIRLTSSKTSRVIESAPSG